MSDVIVSAQAVADVGEKPTFDFEELSYGDSEQFSLNQAKLRRAQETNDVETMAACFAHMRCHLAKVIKSVPRSWLVKNAPTKLDWSDPASITFIKDKRSVALIEAMNEAKEKDSKN